MFRNIYKYTLPRECKVYIQSNYIIEYDVHHARYGYKQKREICCNIPLFRIQLSICRQVKISVQVTSLEYIKSFLC